MVDFNRPFHASARDYIESLIRQRKYLVNAGKSHADQECINHAIYQLDKYMTAYKYDQDPDMEKFWLSRLDLIQHLIPGRNAGGHDASIGIFYALTRAASVISRCPAAPVTEYHISLN